MSPVHLHLLLNHIPVVGSLFVLALLTVALVRAPSSIARTALWTSATLGVVALAVYFTGEPAEHAVEHLPGVSEPLIEQHEELALVATTMIVVFGALSLGVLAVFRGRALPRWAIIGGLLGMLAVTGVMAWTANLGGQIRHTEIRAEEGGAPRVPGGEEEDH
jgi:hypothetical protein